MTQRINNGNGYLYCDIDIDITSSQENYESSEECFEDYKEEIIEDCQKRGYTDIEMGKVLDYYMITLNMANGNWDGLKSV